MKSMRRLPGMLCIVALIATTVADAIERKTALPLSAFPRESIVIETPGARRHVFEVWRADTPATRAQGLMFVTDLAPGRGMIFVYARRQQPGMWMKNTLIPLDMLFVDAEGCVVHVHERAEPGSLETIISPVPASLVVEIRGGLARELGLDRGDRVLRPEAGWPASPSAYCGRAD
jgi:uncharacterized membrane protein (UPF0127 family)